MRNLNNPTSFFWRATSALLRAPGALLTRAAREAYARSFPKLSAEERRLISANEKFRDCHAGRRCFVIGNGPSIRSQDLSPLANEITFVMSAFWKHPVVEQWQPTYYLFSDPLFFDRSAPSKEFFDDLRTRIHKTTFLVPLQYKTAVEEEQLLPPASTCFFALKSRHLGEDRRDSFDFTGELPFTQTIAQLAIIAAIYMGCSPINLIGFDHDWLARIGGGGYYFFEGLTMKNHPNAFTKPIRYDLEMESMLKVWKGYHRLKEMAEQRGVRIFNATDGGFLDLFERLSYDSLFEKAEWRAREA